MSQQKTTLEYPKKPGLYGVGEAQRRGSAKSEGKCVYKWSLFLGLSRVDSCFPGLEEEAIPEWG